MISKGIVSLFSLCILSTCMVTSCATTANSSLEANDIPILQQWSGDYPIGYLNRLPQGQQKSGVGYISDAAFFTAVWQVFKPGGKTPEVDFNKNFIVFSRNVEFYNRTSIVKIILKDSAIEIIAMETMSALPIEDKVAMALAVIPRAGISSITAGGQQIPVKANQ